MDEMLAQQTPQDMPQEPIIPPQAKSALYLSMSSNVIYYFFSLNVINR